MKTLSAKQVKDLISQNEELRLINVLPEEEYRQKHIPGSINVPLGDESFLQRVESLARNRDDPLVMYCASTECNASPKATERLEEAGYRNVADFEGGLAEWESAGYDVEGQAVGDQR